jgi:DNA sulfur modification protein DndE
MLKAGPLPERSVSAAEAFNIGVQAYTYAYPLVLFGQTQLVDTNVATAGTTAAPLNEFAYGTIAGPNETDVVLPNVNVLYDNAFLNLQSGPMVLHIPDTQGRFFIQEILDAWTNVDYDPGMRLNTAPGDYLIAGPGWTGTPPAGITQVFQMPTNQAWILGRTFTTGEPDDVNDAAVIQHEFTLTPLSAYGTAYTPPPNPFVNPAIDTQTPPINQVSNMSAGTFFGMLATMWMANPPQSVDGPTLAQLAQVGLVPGQPYNLSQQPKAIQAGMTEAARAALRYISSEAALLQVGPAPLNGWSLTTTFTGQWDTKYLDRAVTAYRGIGINSAYDAVYAYANRDGTDRLLNGANRYTITFPAGSLPPVEQPYGQNGFWSVTVYNAAGFLGGETPNVIGSTQITAGTWQPNADGSYTIVIQQQQPRDTSNWIKPPDGDFLLLLRMYTPLPQVYDPTNPQYPYKPPVIKRIPGVGQVGALGPRPGEGGLWENWGGRREKWLQDGIDPRESGGELGGQLIALLGPTYLAYPEHLYNAGRATALGPRPGEGGLWENWGGRRERRLQDDKGHWSFLLPYGGFSLWDGIDPRDSGSELAGELVAELGPGWHVHPEK